MRAARLGHAGCITDVAGEAMEVGHPHVLPPTDGCLHGGHQAHPLPAGQLADILPDPAVVGSAVALLPSAALSLCVLPLTATLLTTPPSPPLDSLAAGGGAGPPGPPAHPQMVHSL